MSETNDEWQLKRLWKKSDGKTFTVEVSQHVEPISGWRDEGQNRWCVYAYIYRTHPRFSRFIGNDMWQGAAVTLPGHSYVSFLKAHQDDEGKIASYQVGWDYDHDGDSRFTRYDTKEKAGEVFYDARELFDFLKAETDAIKPEPVLDYSI